MSVSAPSSVTKTSPCWNGFIVPASTLTYGSNFSALTRHPRLLSRRPSEADVMPFPSAEATPPVTKMYLVCCCVIGCVPPQSTASSGRVLPVRPSSFAAPRQLRAQQPIEARAPEADEARPARRPRHPHDIFRLERFALLAVDRQHGRRAGRLDADRDRLVAGKHDGAGVQRVRADRGEHDRVEIG